MSPVLADFATEARQRATFTSGTLGVRVDVLVTERGKPVAGLDADDFEVRDNGVLQRVSVAMALDHDAPFDRDPWWSYRWCAGRDRNALLAAMWASVPRAR